jgi:serine/threonine-protein kinase RsbW
VETGFARIIAGGLFEVKPAVGDALRFIDQRTPCLSDSDRHELKLIFSELLYNAVIHGNRSDARKKIEMRVECAASADGCDVVSTITDEGRGFDYLRVMREMNESDAITREHGRGVKLVSELTNRLEYNGSGNSVRFLKKVAPECDLNLPDSGQIHSRNLPDSGQIHPRDLPGRIRADSGANPGQIHSREF